MLGRRVGEDAFGGHLSSAGRPKKGECSITMYVLPVLRNNSSLPS